MAVVELGFHMVDRVVADIDPDMVLADPGMVHFDLDKVSVDPGLVYFDPDKVHFGPDKVLVDLEMEPADQGKVVPVDPDTVLVDPDTVLVDRDMVSVDPGIELAGWIVCIAAGIRTFFIYLFIL